MKAGSSMIKGRKLKEWLKDYPLLEPLLEMKEVFWINPKYQPHVDWEKFTLNQKDVQEAEERWRRFAPFLRTVFPETKKMTGIIESPLIPIPKMKKELEKRHDVKIPGQLWMKCDSHLPISGSIKARGGIYEVLKHAEDLAIQHGLLTKNDDYAIMADDVFRRLFSQYTIAVGSTGNLGLSIGIMGAKLGFRVIVHMSQEAKEWKKKLLKSHGVKIVEHRADYTQAVKEGRKQAEADPHCYFIDDENSPYLFLGYATAALRLQKQLMEQGIHVDEDHPLFVYLPCGVGGGPGGVTFGLKLLFGPHVHCFFAEPTHSPCMLLGLMTGYHDQVSVQDFGLDNQTEADGLAVGRPSQFVGRIMEPLLSGSYTVHDEVLFRLLKALADTQEIYLEPSALAGIPGVVRLFQSKEGQDYLHNQSLKMKWEKATHIVWATGGSMVPKEVMVAYCKKGEQLSK